MWVTHSELRVAITFYRHHHLLPTKLQSNPNNATLDQWETSIIQRIFRQPKWQVLFYSDNMTTMFIIWPFLGPNCHIIEIINVQVVGPTVWFALGSGSTWWIHQWANLSCLELIVLNFGFKTYITLFSLWGLDGDWGLRDCVDLQTIIIKLLISLLDSKCVLTLDLTFI